MKWFKHEANCGFDSKMKKLLIKYGVNGYGLYYYCVEIIAGNLTTENITFELQHDVHIIAHDLKMDTLLVEEIMLYCIKIGLFQFNEETQRVSHMGLFKMLDNTMSQNTCIRQLKSSENFKFLKDTESRREEKRREEKKDIATKKFKKPSLSQINEYCEQKQYQIDSEYFYNYYESKDWMVGKNKMKDWKAALRNWFKNEKKWKPEAKTVDEKIQDEYPEIKQYGGYCG